MNYQAACGGYGSKENLLYMKILYPPPVQSTLKHQSHTHPIQPWRRHHLRSVSHTDPSAVSSIIIHHLHNIHLIASELAVYHDT